MGKPFFCSAKPMKYKRLIQNIYPKDPSQEPRPVTKLSNYISQEKTRVPRVGKTLVKLLDKQLKKANHRHVEVTVFIVNELMQTTDFSLIASHILSMVSKLFDQTQIQFRLLALETFTTFIERRDQSDIHLIQQIANLVSTVEQLATPPAAAGGGRATSRSVGHRTSVIDLAYKGKRYQHTDLSTLQRKLAFKALYQLTRSAPSVIETKLDSLVPVILFADDVPPSAGELTPVIEFEDATVGQSAYSLLGALSALHNSLTVMRLMERIVAIIHEKNLWIDPYDRYRASDRVKRVMLTIATSVQPQHGHIIFTNLFRILDADDLELSEKRSILEVIAYAATHVHAGPWVLDGLNSVARNARSVFLNQTQPASPEDTQALSNTLIKLAEVLAGRLQSSQTTEVMMMFLQKFPLVQIVLEQQESNQDIPVDERALFSPTNMILTEAQRLFQKSLVAIISAVVEKSNTNNRFQSVNQSQMLRTLMFVTLALDVDTRRGLMAILLALLTDKPLQAILDSLTPPTVSLNGQSIGVRVVEDARGVQIVQFDNSVTTSKPAAVRTRVSIDESNDPNATAIADSSPPMVHRNKKKVPSLNFQRPMAVDRRRSSWVMKAGPQLNSEWPGTPDDFELLHDVLFRHLVIPLHDDVTLRLTYRLLSTALSCGTIHHMALAVPMLLHAQDLLAAKNPRDTAELHSVNGAFLVISSHLTSITNVLNNAALRAHLESVQILREHKHQLHPLLVESKNETGAITIELRSTPITNVNKTDALINPVLLRENLLKAEQFGELSEDQRIITKALAATSVCEPYVVPMELKVFSKRARPTIAKPNPVVQQEELPGRKWTFSDLASGQDKRDVTVVDDMSTFAAILNKVTRAENSPMVSASAAMPSFSGRPDSEVEDLPEGETIPPVRTSLLVASSPFPFMQILDEDSASGVGVPVY
eukprot:c52769_g1_i1.p1 GENE.c52769_g1_i1~~c52769_g1_i1.p1  ORF type:complete len:935 (-),score=218.12 c52769_g1_i1:54-2858(-)